MDVVLKRRLIGAAVLISAGVLIPIILVKLAQPSAPPTGESVRVYEITPSGQARPVAGNQAKSDSQHGTDNAEAKEGKRQSASGKDQPSVYASVAEGINGKASPPKPEAVAPKPHVEQEAPKPKTKPKTKPAPEPKSEPRPKSKPEPEPMPKPEPKPKPEPAPAPQPQANTSKPPVATAKKPYFVVQIGSFGEENNAMRLIQELRRDFPVYYRQGEVGGKQVYRVRVGPYDSREAAEIVATRLRERGKTTQTMSLP